MIKLYSTHCPKCVVVETKLNQLQIPFELITDTDIVIETGNAHGIDSAPILEVDGNFYNFSQAINYLKTVGGNR